MIACSILHPKKIPFDFFLHILALHMPVSGSDANADLRTFMKHFEGKVNIFVLQWESFEKLIIVTCGQLARFEVIYLVNEASNQNAYIVQKCQEYNFTYVYQFLSDFEIFCDWPKNGLTKKCDFCGKYNINVRKFALASFPETGMWIARM